MDSVTQITLGAAVGQAVAGRKADIKAPLWGAVLGTLPDLDTLSDFVLTEAQALTFHRSVTHSFVFVVVVALLGAFGLRRLHNDLPVSTTRWGAMIAAVLLSHIGLDCLTTYGTQVFWPFSRDPVILGTIYVIDPFYTVPLAAGLLLSFRWDAGTRARRWSNYAGLAVSSAYLLFTVANKLHVNEVFEAALDQQVPSAERMLTRPTPFNNILWWGITEADDGYYMGLYSLLDDDRRIDFRRVPKRHHLLGDAIDHPAIQQVRRFSRGYYTVHRDSTGTLRISDLRFGRNDMGLTADGEYVFSFRIEKAPDGTVTRLDREEPPVSFTRPLLRQFLARIAGRTPETAFAPTPPGPIPSFQSPPS